jgi:archaellum component FlaC
MPQYQKLLRSLKLIMKKDQEPEQLASIAISRDEIVGRQRPTGSIRSQPTNSSAPKLLWLLVVFSVLFSVGILVHLQKVKLQSDKQLKALTILQDRLSSTDQQSNLSVDAIKILLRDQDHEIRKLWDVANKRNKGQISKHKTRLDDQSKLIAQYSSKIEQLGKEAASQKKNVTNNIKESEQATRSQVQSVKNDISEIETRVEKSIKGIPSNLSKTLSDHTKGIKAMDRTRLQLLKKIKSLEADIKLLKSRPANTAQAPTK